MPITLPEVTKPFDVEKPFEFIFNGEAIHVRYPHDGELIARQKATQTVMRTLNGGDTVAERPDMDKIDAADIALFNQIHLDAEMTVDVDTALRIVSILDNGSIKSCKKDAGTWLVHLRILGGVKGAPSYDTHHLLKDPTFRDERRYKTLSQFRSMKGGRFKVETSLQAAGDMYDSLRVDISGYTGNIPVTHKNAVLDTVMRKVMEATQEIEPEETEETENF